MRARKAKAAGLPMFLLLAEDGMMSQCINVLKRLTARQKDNVRYHHTSKYHVYVVARNPPARAPESTFVFQHPRKNCCTTCCSAAAASTSPPSLEATGSGMLDRVRWFNAFRDNYYCTYIWEIIYCINCWGTTVQSVLLRTTVGRLLL